jgi:Flp pilus assembly pilin Flp
VPSSLIVSPSVTVASLSAVAAITTMGKVGGKISNVLTNVSNAMT